MDTILDCCAGIDVHRDVLQVCILKGTQSNPEVIRSEFKTIQSDLQELVKWLISHNCYMIAIMGNKPLN